MDSEMDSESTNNVLDEKDVLPGFKTLDSYLQMAYPIVAEGIKASNSLPSAKEFGYYKTYPEFINIMKADGLRLQRLMDCLVRRNGLRKTDEGINTVIDSNDKSLDRANDNLLEMDGRKRNPLTVKQLTTQAVPSGGWHDLNKNVPSKEDIVLCVSTGTIRPQVYFKDKIDNRNLPWVPRITEKPNSLKPLSILPELNDLGQEHYSHPYDYELMLWKPKEELLCVSSVKKPRPLEETPFVYVETEEQLNNMLSELKTVSEMAVDLEHHSYRSFMGFTCLMQISTWEKDYVIDTLNLRDKLHILNEVFTKTSILKVFHGAESDIEWLQRDLSLYVVNMFDTYQASKVLGFQRLSLAHLLYKYCKIEAKKEYQLFDWRRRPLPDTAIKYAREDTHYLLYIYQLLRNELIDKACGNSNLLETVFDRSRETCRRVFNKPTLDEDSHMTVYRRLKLNFDNRQLYALREIYRWRDRIARQEDESTWYVLPNHMMVQICRTLPREMQGILACCNPIPPLVRTFLLELHQIVLRAKDQPLVKSLVEESEKRDPVVGKDHRLMYPQDNEGLEFRDDLPTLLGGDFTIISSPPKKKSPIISAFEDITDSKKLKPIGKIKFVSPYQRYLKVLPYAIQLEKEERERIEKEEEERLSNATNVLSINTSENRESTDEEELPMPLAKNRSYVKKARSEGGNSGIKHEPNNGPQESPLRSEGVGIIGGEVSLTSSKKKKTGPPRDADGWTIPNADEAYDYRNVDYQKFQSGSNKRKKGKMPQNNSKWKTGDSRGNNRNRNNKNRKKMKIEVNL